MTTAARNFMRSARNRGATALLLLTFLPGIAGCSSPEEKAKSYYENGQKFLDQKDYVRAALEFRNALKIKQDFAEAWFGMAQVEEHDKNWNLVAGDLKKVLELDPKHGKARMALARLVMLSGNFPEALQQTNLALEINPKDAGLVALKAAVLLKMDRKSEAIGEANRALSIDPANADALMVLAAERMAGEDYAAAQKFLETGLKAQPKSLGLLLFSLSLYQKSGDKKGQEAALREIVSIDPKQAGYRKALVSFLVNEHRNDEAEKELRIIAQDNPDDLQANLDVVRFLAAFPGRGPETAIVELKRLIETGKNTNSYKSALAQLYFEIGKSQESTDLLKQVIADEKISDVGIAARLDLSGKYLITKRLEEAQPLIDEVLANDARNVEALRQRAAIATERGKLDDAAADLRVALGEAPNNPLLYQMMATVNERTGSVELADKSMSDAFRVSKYAPQFGLDYARFLVRRGRSEHAETVLSDLLEIAPNNLEAMSMLADLKLRRQDWQGAQNLADSIKKLPVDTALSTQIEAAALAGQNKLDEGINVLLQAQSQTKENPAAKFMLVKAYIKAGKFAEAEEHLNTILKADPNDINAKIFLGIVQAGAKRPDEARATISAAISADPKNPAGHRAMADLLAQSGQYDQAIEALKAGLAQTPADLDLRFALASLYQLTNKIDDAIVVYEGMLKDQPGSMLAANNYASLVSDFKTDPQSIEKAASAAAVLRGSPISQFRDTLGWILLLRGQNKEALELLKQSTAELPDMALTNYHLGRAYAATGDKKLALESYMRGKKVSQNDKEAALIDAAIKELGTP